MIKIIDILTNVITEQKRFQFDPETYKKLVSLTEKLWGMRNKDLKKKTLVDGFEFKTSDGTDGYVKVIVNPRLKYIGFMDTKPKFSRDPMDFVMELQPKEYGSKKNLFLTIYHEMLHATDPSQSTKMSPKFLSTYNEKKDESYWGHPIEFRAITNEFLEGLVNEFKRRIERLRNLDNKRFLIKSLDNILNYFGKGEPLNKLSLDILSRINDENMLDNKISKVFSNMTADYPKTSEFVSPKEEPYYITYIELIKKYNPAVWPKFLTMLYNTSEEIKSIINKKGV
jgi:hypothetical protein